MEITTPSRAGSPTDGERRRAYLELPVVRRRMIEYLGGESLEDATARFVITPTPRVGVPAIPLPTTSVWQVLERHLEVARSLWDRASLLAHLDVEHVSFDDPWAPLLDLGRSSWVQRTAVDAIEAHLRERSIEPLHLLTGRGHHFVWRVERGSPAFVALRDLGALDDEMRRRYEERRPPGGEIVGADVGAAQHGLGKVLEHLAHQVMERAGAISPVPVLPGAVVVGVGPHGREIVSIDISQFGDPLWTRSARLPFSLYRKPALLGGPAELSDATLVTVPVPVGNHCLARAAEARGDLDAAAALAASTETAIPDAEPGMLRLIAEYRESALAAFHREFESVTPHAAAEWPSTYDRLDLEALPACVCRILEAPNDLLLRPACIQLVVRTLLAQGWEAGHVAGLVRSKYGRDHGWIPGIHFEIPGLRADFYTRLFAGMIATGRDPLVDLNCVSTREKGLCTGERCGWDLRTLRAALLEVNP